MNARALLSALLLAAPLAGAVPCPTHASWPTTEWPRSPVDTTAKAAQLKALEDYAFTITGKDSEQKGLRTDALLLIKNGAIIYERYARGYKPANRHIAWSVSKSVSSLLAGVAVQQGALSVDDSICKRLPEYSGDVCKITLKDALTFVTGLDWQEVYEHDPYQLSSDIAAFFGVGHKDQLAFILHTPIKAAPGEVWHYSTADAQLASVVVKRALVAKTGEKAPFWPYLFDKLGISDVVFEEDVKGTPLGGSMVFATPEQFAKLGYFAMNDGCWAGERLLPEGWMKTSTSVSDGFLNHAAEKEKTPTGYSWWLNLPLASRNQEKPWKDAPDDTFLADGHWGQFIIMVPSEDTIIVRTGDDRNADMDNNELLKLSLAVTR